MLLAISNLAWRDGDLAQSLTVVKQAGFDGVELVPGLIWDDPVQSSASERRALADQIKSSGLEIVGLHRLLDHRPDLRLFSASRGATREYLKRLCSLCSDLGGETLVLGSTSNRTRGGLSMEDAVLQASEMFAEVAAEAVACGVCLLIDPVPAADSDFVVSVDEAADLVRETSHPNFRLHVDVGTAIAGGEDIAARFADVRKILTHVHVSDPGLTAPGSTGVDHGPVGAALRAAGYNRRLTVVMTPRRGAPADVIARSLEYTRSHYLSETVA